MTLFEFVGDFARNTDTIERLDILSDAYPKDFSVALHSLGFTSNDDTLFSNPSGLKVMIHYSSEEEFEMNDFLLSAHPEHLKLLEFDEDEFILFKNSPYYSIRQKCGKKGKIMSDLKEQLKSHPKIIEYERRINKYNMNIT